MLCYDDNNRIKQFFFVHHKQMFSDYRIVFVIISRIPVRFLQFVHFVRSDSCIARFKNTR